MGLTELIEGSELEEENEEEGDVCGEGVKDEGVDEVGGLEESEKGSEEEGTGVVEEAKEAKTVDENVRSLREDIDVVEVLTSSLEEVETGVLLARLLDPLPAVPDGELFKAMYPYKPWSSFPQLLSG